MHAAQRKRRWNRRRLSQKGRAESGYGSLNGDWTVFGLARSGVQVAGKYYETYYGNVEAAVTEAGGKLSETKYTEYSRLVLALTAIGRDPRGVAAMTCSCR